MHTRSARTIRDHREPLSAPSAARGDTPVFDNARVTDQHVPYPGSDDERTQRDLWPTDTREVAYDASVDRWLRSKTRRAHAKTIAAPPPPRSARAQQLSLTSEDFSAIATFALDQRLISADQGLGVARTLARACRTSPFYDAATAYVPVHVTYLLTRPSRTRSAPRKSCR